MLSIAAAPFYIALNIYIIHRFFAWLESCGSVFGKKRIKMPVIIVYVLFALSLVIAFFMPEGSQPKRIVQLAANYWLGILLYTLLITAAGHLLSLLLRRVFKVLPADFFKSRKNHIISGAVTLAAAAAVSIYGMAHAHDIKLKEYSISINKSMNESIKAVLVADWHLGYSIGKEHMRKMTELINAQEPDIVFVAGDIYDNSYEAIDDPDGIAEILSGINSRYGVYACWGNHDVDEKILGGFTFDYDAEKSHSPEVAEFLEKAGIKLLEDECILIDGSFYIAGRVDGEKPATDGNVRKTPAELLEGVDRSRPVFVMYHEPDELAELAAVGTDILLSGHTHNGQVFPGNLTIKLAWENAYGCIKKDDMYSIVTSGVGVWGPFMRVGTDAEVVSIEITGK